MSLPRKLNSTILVMLGLVQLQCLGDAPRNNPLDPKSNGFQDTGSIRGMALSLFPPFQPIDGVELRLTPGNFFGKTGASGEFVFQNVPSGPVIVSALKPRFGAMHDTVEVQPGESVSVTFNMDGLPAIDSVMIFSCTFNNLFPVPDIRFLQVEAKVTDPDGVNDVRLVEFLIPEINVQDTLAVTSELGAFRKIITEADLPITRLENLVGKQMLIRVTDSAGFTTTSQPAFLNRVISNRPKVVSPDRFELLNETNPILIWESITLPFNFSFRIEVVRFRLGIEAVVWTQDGINSSQTTIQVEPQLPTSFDFSYFWTVSVVDEFGNWSRSVASSFRIN